MLAFKFNREREKRGDCRLVNQLTHHGLFSHLSEWQLLYNLRRLIEKHSQTIETMREISTLKSN